jgi:hypothetical protein
MGIYPKKYNKEEFLIFLKENNVSDLIINKFVELPETVERSGCIFKLDINSTWYSSGKTYKFELNYYSEELVEYLFSSKVFNDVEISINFLLCELINNHYIKDEECDL